MIIHFFPYKHWARFACLLVETSFNQSSLLYHHHHHHKIIFPRCPPLFSTSSPSSFLPSIFFFSTTTTKDKGQQRTKEEHNKKKEKGKSTNTKKINQTKPTSWCIYIYRLHYINLKNKFQKSKRSARTPTF